MSKILVVANGEPPTPQLLHDLLQSHSRLIAVDGGLNTCLKYGVEPEIVIGDFDSSSKEVRNQYSHITQIHTPNQHKTDLEKALEYLSTFIAETITVCGALGRRVDHTMTNICLLCHYPGKVKFETETQLCFALPTTVELTCQKGQTLSLIPVCSQVEGVTTRGLKWELHGDLLNKDFVAISNVCLDTSVFISFKTGNLVACLLKPKPLESAHELDNRPKGEN